MDPITASAAMQGLQSFFGGGTSKTSGILQPVSADPNNTIIPTITAGGAGNRGTINQPSFGSSSPNFSSLLMYTAIGIGAILLLKIFRVF